MNNTATNISTSDPFGSATGQNAVEPVVGDTSVVAEAPNAIRDIATFVDDAQVVTHDSSHNVNMAEDILALNDTNNDEQSIKTFLARPIVVSQGNFSIADTYSFLNSLSMPYSGLQLALAGMWKDKLKGIFGIRFDMKFRIVINANKFQQGRYCLGWVPLAGPVRSTSALKELAFNNTHMATLVQRTTVPRVEFDLCKDTVAELTVPFVSSKNFYPLNAIFGNFDTYSLGYLNLYPYVPMSSPAGSTVAGYTIYMSFENVRFFGASSPQGRRLVDHSAREVTNTSNGPISSVSSAISKGFKEFSHIPMLSSYATGISWVADRITTVASVFGWSKPTQGDSLTKFTLLQASNHNTIDGDSDARALSYLSKPGVVNLDGASGVDYDEMDFSYICRIPAWFLTFTWTTGVGANALLAQYDVKPYMYLDAGGCRHFQPVAFVASFFRGWRGSLRYKIKIVKTEFHSGRISIAFHPASTFVGYAATDSYVNRMIVDIRDSEEVDFVVPYIHESQYCNGRTGSIVIRVVDPLVAPATVSSAITFVVEISGGDDIEFAIPESHEWTPQIFTPQGPQVDESKLVTMNIGNTIVTANPHTSSSLAVGDKVSNFRAYLKRFHPMRPSDMSAASTIKFNSSSVTVFSDGIHAVTNPTPATYIRADIFSSIASCYAICRGGCRLRDVIDKNMQTSTLRYSSMVKTFSQPITSAGFSGTIITSQTNNFEVNGNWHAQFQDLQLNGVITAEQPQYTNTNLRSVCDMFNFSGSAYGYAYGNTASTTQNSVTFAVPESNATAVVAQDGYQLHNLFRAFADDGNLGTFISVPAMLFTGSVVSGKYNMS